MNGTLPMAVDARNLTYRYGSFTAVDDVTLQVRPGETMLLTTHYVTSPTA